MDLRALVERIILEYANIPYAYEPDLARIPVFDSERGQYLLMVVGWGAEGERVHYCLIHVAIRGDTIWIEHDGTEEGVAADLERAGIGKDRIVLAFHRPEMQSHTGYAVAR
jgi:hypothetical protein